MVAIVRVRQRKKNKQIQNRNLKLLVERDSMMYRNLNEWNTGQCPHERERERDERESLKSGVFLPVLGDVCLFLAVDSVQRFKLR